MLINFTALGADKTLDDMLVSAIFGCRIFSMIADFSIFEARRAA
jgi:hypothetical protein